MVYCLRLNIKKNLESDVSRLLNKVVLLNVLLCILNYLSFINDSINFFPFKKLIVVNQNLCPFLDNLKILVFYLFL